MPGKARERRTVDGRQLQFDTIKICLYPTPEQAELFEKTFGCCRYIWNQMLADHEKFYVETGKHFIPTPAKYKAGAPFLKEVDSQALIQEHGIISQAFRLFFKNPAVFGYPKFKRKKDDKNSFTVCNHDFDSGPTIYLTKNGIRLTKAGIVNAKLPRRPRNGWKLKRVTVEKTKTEKYFWDRSKAQALAAMRRVLAAMDTEDENVQSLRRQLNHIFPQQEKQESL